MSEPLRARRPRTALWLWLAACAAAAAIAARAHYVADLSAFLPSAPTPEQAVLLDQLQGGAASRLLLAGIEGGDASTRAAASKRLAAALRQSGRFVSVENGDSTAWQEAGRFVFAHRYALSPAVDAARFTSAGLHDAIEDTLSLLGTPAGSLVKPILFRDPTGESMRIAEALTPAQAPRSEQGVWVSRNAPRAVLVMTTRATGGDIDGLEQAIAAVRGAFAGVASVGPTSLRLQLSGPARFSVDARARIKGEVERLAGLGAALVVALLWIAFGSLRPLAIAALPVATGVVAGIAAVALGFGQVHGMTLGFGSTLIGEGVDYAIYYLVQARALGDRQANGSRARDRWLRGSWPTVRLGLFTSLIGFAALVFAGFPGLAQLGVFSIAGLAAAAATTRYVLTDIAPEGAPGEGLRRRLGRFMARASALLPRARWPLAGIAALGAVLLLLVPSPWHGALTDLSPIGAADLKLDAELRNDVGAPDAGTLVAVSARDEADALAGAEAVGARLDALVRAGALAGYSSPARFLPSPATQRARLAALPDASTLAARLATATAGGALPADRLQPFIDDVQAARDAAPFTRAALGDGSLGAAVDALLLRGDAQRPWRALVNLQSAPDRPIDIARLRAAIAAVPGAEVVAVKAELDALYARYVQQAMWQAGLGALAVAVLLAWHLRDARRLLRVLEPLVAAVLVVLALLAASGAALGILHLVGLLLTVALGSNYALFFDHLRQRGHAVEGDDADTLASLLLANLTTVISFGLLASSRIPVLQAVGEVVAPGALLCLVFSAAFIGRPAEPRRAYGTLTGP